MADLSTILSWFETGDIPTQEQFQQTFSSFRHKDVNITMNDITGLESVLNNKLGTNHSTDVNAHNSVLAKIDASNLNYDNIQLWKQTLGVGDIPDNVALVDVGEAPEVYNKAQILAMTMLLSEYTISGKIRADKIEALGLTDLVEASETSLADFAVSSDNYIFQQNDFIAIPVNGNFSLYIYKGGDKTVTGNYLATGLTNITIPMVEGLQTALNSKLDKPKINGKYLVKMDGTPSYQAINLASSYLLFWDGNDFKTSSIFRENGGLKFGIGTTLPTEQLHLTSRARMSALVLEDNPESLPQQITYNSRKFFGTDSTGLKRQFQYADYDGWLNTVNAMTTAQALNIAQLLNGGAGSAGNMSVNLISPPIIQNQFNTSEYVMIQGANLNLSAISRKIEILAADKVTVVVEIPDNQIQVYSDGLSLVFYYNFYNFTEGQYFIRLTSGSKIYVTTLDINIVPAVANIDLSTITWDLLLANGLSQDVNDSFQGANFTINSNISSSGSTIPTKSLKSSEIFSQGDDFYLELSITLSRSSGGTGYIPSFLGIGYSNTINILSPANQTWFEFSWASGLNYFLGKNNGGNIIYDGVGGTFNLVIIKTGNLFRSTIKAPDGSSSTVAKTLSNNSGYSIFSQFVDRPAATITQVSILKAFKFN